MKTAGNIAIHMLARGLVLWNAFFCFIDIWNFIYDHTWWNIFFVVLMFFTFCYSLHVEGKFDGSRQSNKARGSDSAHRAGAAGNALTGYYTLTYSGKGASMSQQQGLIDVLLGLAREITELRAQIGHDQAIGDSAALVRAQNLLRIKEAEFANGMSVLRPSPISTGNMITGNLGMLGPGQMMKPGGVVTWSTPSPPSSFGGNIPTLGGISFVPQFEDVARCSTCGAAYRSSQGKHECTAPSDEDLAAVARIQKICREGPDSETVRRRVESEMGVKVGWRYWQTARGALYGLGTGRDAAWPRHRPIIAACVDTDCCGQPDRCSATGYPGYNAQTKPVCRIHALNAVRCDYDHRLTPDGQFIKGAVALWGDVITCTGGYLATRGYPVTLTGHAEANWYGVAFEDQKEPRR